MKKYTKILILCLAIFLATALIIAITLLNKKDYSDNYSATELYNAVSNSFYTDGGIKTLDSDVILEFTDKDIPYLKDYTVVKANNAKNINEVGVFRVEDGKSNYLKEVIEKYVSNLQQSYRTMDYFPEEVEKIDFATVKVFGNYVIYSFLNEKDTDSFYSSVEKIIQK